MAIIPLFTRIARPPSTSNPRKSFGPSEATGRNLRPQNPPWLFTKFCESMHNRFSRFSRATLSDSAINDLSCKTPVNISMHKTALSHFFIERQRFVFSAPPTLPFYHLEFE
jgi:hypothetical protein